MTLVIGREAPLRIINFFVSVGRVIFGKNSKQGSIRDMRKPVLGVKEPTAEETANNDTTMPKNLSANTIPSKGYVLEIDGNQHWTSRKNIRKSRSTCTTQRSTRAHWLTSLRNRLFRLVLPKALAHKQTFCDAIGHVRFTPKKFSVHSPLSALGQKRTWDEPRLS
jgi:hypothetical protein